MTEQKTFFTLRAILLMVLVVLVAPFLPILISGEWGWWEAWVYATLYILSFVFSRALAARKNPDILEERARSIELQGAKAWDKVLAPLLAFGSIFILIVAGLDKLNSWTSPYSLTLKIMSLIVIVLGYAVGSWALIENKFFSGVVRIQTERGHHVVSTGPYRFVRHPGYAGALWMYLASPIWFDSNWAFIPAAVLFVVMLIRTPLEDQTLQQELAGYREFTHKTKYRLFPGIW
jgi:protein-S-isoprenylcysteine O-methyltransferase Ste14